MIGVQTGRGRRSDVSGARIESARGAWSQGRMASGDAAAMIRLQTHADRSIGLHALLDRLQRHGYRSRRQAGQQKIAAVRARLWQRYRESGAIDPAKRSGRGAFGTTRHYRGGLHVLIVGDGGPSRLVHFAKWLRNSILEFNPGPMAKVGIIRGYCTCHRNCNCVIGNCGRSIWSTCTIFPTSPSFSLMAGRTVAQLLTTTTRGDSCIL